MYGIVNVASVFLLDEDLKSRTDEVLYGWAIKIIGKKGKFFKVVTHYGYTGYIIKDAVKEVSQNYLKNRKVDVIVRNTIDVLSLPKVEGDILITLFKGSLIETNHNEKDGYFKVSLLDGASAWAPYTGLAVRGDSDNYLIDNDSDYFLKQNKPDETIFRKAVVDTAKSYLGTQYRWSGKTPQGIDCSGLTFMSYMLNGILIYRDAKIKEKWPIKEINFEELRPGDLIYFPGHVAMYIGNNHYINSTGYSKHYGVAISSLNKDDTDYRDDLFHMIEKCGSLF